MAATLVRQEYRGHPPAKNLALNEKIKNLRREGADICHLAFGQSPFSIPRPMTEALRENAHRQEYLPVQGLPALLEEVSRMHTEHDGVEVIPSQVVVAPGSKELIFLTMKLFDGDVILVSPAWTTYAPQARLARGDGKEPLIVETAFEDEWKLTPRALRAALDRRAKEEKFDKSKKWLMVLNNPGNPSGTSYTEAELNDLALACRELNVTVLVDEIYGRLRFDDGHVSGIRAFGSGCVVTSGFSKWSSAGGWRVGYAVVPDAGLRAALVAAASHTYSCAPAPMQAACAAALRDAPDEVEAYRAACREVLRAVADVFVRELRSVGVKVHPSSSGYYVFPDFGVCKPGLNALGVRTAEQFCARMLEEAGVAMLHGTAMLRPEEEWTARLCYVDFDGDLFLREMLDGDGDGLAKAEVTEADVRRLAPDLCRGLDRLKEFVVRHSK